MPGLGAYIAMGLEVGILSQLLQSHAWAGVVMWVVYLWFSSTLFVLDEYWEQR